MTEPFGEIPERSTWSKVARSTMFLKVVTIAVVVTIFTGLYYLNGFELTVITMLALLLVEQADPR